MPVAKTSWLSFQKKPDIEITDLTIVKEGDVLILRVDRDPEAVAIFNSEMYNKATVPVGEKYTKAL